MYKKVVYWLRAHKLYAVLEMIVRLESITRYRITERFVDSWYENTGRLSKEVRDEMRIFHGWRKKWNELSLDEKRSIYCSVSYY